jgi:hypothetical protein
MIDIEGYSLFCRDHSSEKLPNFMKCLFFETFFSISLQIYKLRIGFEPATLSKNTSFKIFQT